MNYDLSIWMRHWCCTLFCLLWHVICIIMCCIVQRDISAFTTDVSVVDSSIDPERTHNTDLTDSDHTNDNHQVSISMSGEETLLNSHSWCPFTFFYDWFIICAVRLSGWKQIRVQSSRTSIRGLHVCPSVLHAGGDSVSFPPHSGACEHTQLQIWNRAGS